jgi:hypothetical protein
VDPSRDLFSRLGFSFCRILSAQYFVLSCAFLTKRTRYDPDKNDLARGRIQRGRMPFGCIGNAGGPTEHKE